MIVERKSIDLNAYILNMHYTLKTENDKKQIVFSFKNMQYGIIKAIKLTCVAYDSFDDVVEIDGKDNFEVKKADLTIWPGQKASFIFEIENYDIKKLDIAIKQILFSKDNLILPKEEEIVEYNINKLKQDWRSDDTFEKDALEIMHQTKEDAICFPQEHERGWICACGHLNLNDRNKCMCCGEDKKVIFEQFSEQTIKHKVEVERERKRIEEEKKIISEKEEQEKKAKREKTIGSIALIAIVMAIVIAVVSVFIHNSKYGLSNEEKETYYIAQSNYQKIENFCMIVGNDFWGKAYSYDNYSSLEDNNIDVAEKDKDYIYLRGLYKATSLLYELIKEQYPEKYHEVYEQLIRLHKGDIMNDVLIDENLYVKGLRVTDSLENQKSIAEAIEKMETYMDKEVLNPAKVESVLADLPEFDYSNVYGINLGILYYGDGNIKYIGEFANGMAEGFGKAWYPETSGGTMCEGTFSSGKFISGEHYDTDGYTNDINEVKKEMFEGEFEQVKEVGSSKTSASVAKENTASAEKDEMLAVAEAERYLQDIYKKYDSIKDIAWLSYPLIENNDYCFHCTVDYGDFKKEGTLTVEKQSDGTFKAIGLELD